MTETRPRLLRARRILAGLPLLPLADGLRVNWNPADHPRGPDGKFGVSGAALAEHYRANVTPSGAERAALHDYAGVAYQAMNGFLRGNAAMRPSDPAHPGADYAPEIAALSALAGRYSTPAPATVRRFTHHDAVPAAPMAPGTVLTDRGFASSTLGGAAPEQFAGYPVEMRIEVPAGSHGIVVNGVGKGTTGIGAEGEFIMPPGTSFTVAADESRAGTRLITMRASTPGKG